MRQRQKNRPIRAAFVSAVLLITLTQCDVAIVTLCSMERYEGYWELTGQDRDGHDLDGHMSIFPFIGDFQLFVRTMRTFSQSGTSCYRGGSRTECGSGVVPELSFSASPSRDCGTVISLDRSYRDTQGEVTAVARITFTSSRTATVRLEAIPSRSWSPVSATLTRVD